MPLVSAIMPTHGKDRFDWALQAIDCYASQTYPNKELIILDDEDAPTFQRAPQGCRYSRIAGDAQMTIPEKRNRLCTLSNGEYIWHLDSDDWSASGRMMLQIELLDASRRSVCGFSSMIFHVESTNDVFEYTSHRDYALGTSLCYRKSWWRGHRWGPLAIGSDNAFVRTAAYNNQLITIPGSGLMVARVHSGNTSIKNTTNPVYVRASTDRIPSAFHATAPSRT